MNDLQGKIHLDPLKPSKEIFDTIHRYEIASFYRATSSCMSEADRQKCLDAINGRLTCAYVEVVQLFYLSA